MVKAKGRELDHSPVVTEATFVAGAAYFSELPHHRLPEVAIIGRSNSGKSTFINRLAGRNKLARTSSTPGRTQQINVFRLTIAGERMKKREFHLVDLPGYGYARLSKERREELGAMTVEYIDTRNSLRAVCLLIDCNRDPDRDDLAVRDLVFNAGCHLLIVATKVDRLRANERTKRLVAVARGFGLGRDDIVSAGEDLPVGPIWERLTPLIFSEVGTTVR